MCKRVPYGMLMEVQDMLLNSRYRSYILNWTMYYDTARRAADSMNSSIRHSGNQTRLGTMVINNTVLIYKKS